MTGFIDVTLENEMDLILSYKKAIRLAETLKLTTSTQTTFATAVSEICREVIEKTDRGLLLMGITKETETRYSMTAQVQLPLDVPFNAGEEGFLYAQKLLPHAQIIDKEDLRSVELKISLPRSCKINQARIRVLTEFFQHEQPNTPYEEIKRKNSQLNQLAEASQEELRQTKIINEQKTEFISIASHELKTPVTIIKAYAQLALSLGMDSCPPQIQSYLSKIEVQSSKLTFLIQQLLDVSKIESDKLDYKMEAVNFDTYLNDTLVLMKHIVPSHTLTAQLESPVNVKLDKLRIEQVLSNIIGNAAKYSASGSPIHLSTRVGENQEAIVSVKDMGIGISRENAEKIFEKFYRDESVVQRYSGLGMGLYISSKIIMGHGGRIWAESNEEGGTTFSFSLPVV